MTAEQLIKVCLELDQQCVSPRPSEWGKAARVVHELCRAVSSNQWPRCRLGDWNTVDLASAGTASVSRDLDQPTADMIREIEQLKARIVELEARPDPPKPAAIDPDMPRRFRYRVRPPNGAKVHPVWHLGCYFPGTASWCGWSGSHSIGYPKGIADIEWIDPAPAEKGAGDA